MRVRVRVRVRARVRAGVRARVRARVRDEGRGRGRGRGRFQQPLPPQVPHDLSQHIPPDPRMPWSHLVRVRVRVRVQIMTRVRVRVWVVARVRVSVGIRARVRDALVAPGGRRRGRVGGRRRRVLWEHACRLRVRAAQEIRAHLDRGRGRG